MALDLKSDEAFFAAIEGIPRVVELIAAVPEAKRSIALAAAQQSYQQTAQILGYEKGDAQDWASAVMLQLESASLANAGASNTFTAKAPEAWQIDSQPARLVFGE
jgi:hypothetical protein